MTIISRRDFLNGASLTIAAGLTPLHQLSALAATIGAAYPPALTGLRGSNDGSFEAAHKLRDGEKISIDGLKATERYDLVVVGGGISGLAAAWFYRKRFGARAKILIVDNHDDFGGHARRNEFSVDGRTILGYGGSESFQSPSHDFSDAVNALLKDLKVDYRRFEKYFDRGLYPGHRMSRGVFFNREDFKVDKLVTGDPTRMVADDIPADRMNARAPHLFIRDMPISDTAKSRLIALYQDQKDVLAGKTVDEKKAYLEKISYRDYLKRHWGLDDEAANVFQRRSHDFFALGIDAVPASFAQETGYPGFKGLQLPADAEAEAAFEEPYIYHFPDGNASVARLLVRAMVPGVGAGKTMEDVVTSKFDYAALDRPRNQVRIRLGATALAVKALPKGVAVGYWKADKLTRVDARHCVLACYNMMIPHILKELPADQAEALRENVKAPLVYSKVLLRNWRPWIKLGVHEITAPMSFHTRVKLDYPVSIGRYKFTGQPDDPIGLHMVHVPVEPGDGLTARDQWRIGRQKLLETPFEVYEKQIRDQLDRMLGPGGFNAATDIMGITVNRWSHGYAYYYNSLYDDYDDEGESLINLARKPAGGGHITIANSDAGWDAYMHTAIDEAKRAVDELKKA